ncbi:MAG: hypothetical protein O2U61_00750 [Candidatus Bathyarchaeota archaeon]|nr:hypothetical protein [Candidatus Bathyarchaeota archaeon]
MVSTEKEELPFWMYHNQRGRIEKETNLLSRLSGQAIYDIGQKGILEAGAGFLARDAHSDRAFIDELYLNYTKGWFELIFGRKQRSEVYNGLSASNESILRSLNARPLPGIQLGTTRPVFILRNFGFEASWEEYLMDDERFVDNARLHHKSFHLVYSAADRNFKIKAGIQHFAQWGGTSRIHGKQPNSANDYFRIITGRGGDTDAVEGDQLNVLGNHIGSYELFITKKFKDFDVELLYNHLFEDGSGSRLGNTPDGRYGIFIDFNNKKNWINSLIYEFYYTKHQSSTTTGNHISDDYFNNYAYRSGWTYKNQVIGAPFFLTNYYNEEFSQGFIRIGNNIFVAHHLGISGVAFKKVPYKVLTAYRKNYGHKRLLGGFQNVDHYTTNDPRGKYILPSEILSSYLDLQVLQSDINLDLILAADFSSERIRGGFGLCIKYNIQ